MAYTASTVAGETTDARRPVQTKPAAAAPEQAYMVTGQRIYTMDARRRQVAAVGVMNGRITAVGDVGHVAASLPAGSPHINVGDRMVLPGFTDSHIHFGYLARKWQAVDLAGSRSAEEAAARVAAYTRANPRNVWIDGHGWEAHLWDGPMNGASSRPIPCHILDKGVPDRPAVLASKDGHALWVNSAALRLAGIDHHTPDPAGGRIARAATTGAPTGLLYENAAQLVWNVLPPPDVNALAQAMHEGIPRLHAQGITAIHCPELMADWHAYELLHEQGKLNVRVTFLPPISQQHAFSPASGDEWLRTGQLKIFADGTLGQRTAAMLEPFDGEPDNRGITMYTEAELQSLTTNAVAGGFSVAVHAIGDRAVRLVVDAIQAAGPAPGALPHRVEHAQIVHPDDVGRFRQLHAVASMQPLHCPADRHNADRYWGKRTQHAYPTRSLHDAGVTLAFGSDAPFGLDLTAASFSVLGGVRAAVNRCDAGSEPWHPEQRLTVAEALAAYTVGPAAAGGELRWRGTLEPGKTADMVVLTHDVHEAPRETMANVAVEATIVGGQPVYGQWPPGGQARG